MKYEIGDYVITLEQGVDVDGLTLIKSRIVDKNPYTKQYHLDDLWGCMVEYDEMITDAEKNVILSEERILGKVPKNFTPKQLRKKFPEYFIWKE